MPFKSSLVAMFVLTLALGCGRGASSNVSSIDEPTPESDTVEVSAKADASTSNDKSIGAQDDKDATIKATAAPDAKKANDSDNKKTAQSPHDNALSTPPKAIADADATEMVRAWVVDQQLVCTLRPEIWEDPGTWGVLLADVAYQIANANAELRGIPAKDTLADIAASFNKEMPKPKGPAATSNRETDGSASNTSAKENAKEATETPNSDESAVGSKTNARDKADSDIGAADKPAPKEKPDADRDR